MNLEQQKSIFLKSINHLDDLNSILDFVNENINPIEVADCLDKKTFDLNTNNLNIYLGTLLFKVFTQNLEIIKIKEDDINKLIIINYINTILEKINLNKISFEVI